MATIVATGTPSLASVTPPQSSTIVALRAGEALGAFAPCYVKQSDGLVYQATGAAANAAAKVRGWAATPTPNGEAVTLFTEVNVRYGAGLAPGTDIYLGATAGTIADAASTGGTAPIGYVIDATRIRVWPAATRPGRITRHA